VSVRVLPSTHARRVPWKNGLGSTLELATDAPPGLPWTWRLALAPVPERAPFSSYPGIDRYIAVVQGDGLTLESKLGEVRVPHEGAGLPFAGETPIVGRPDGPDVLDVNLMVVRSVWRASLEVVRDGHFEATGDVVLVHAFGAPVRVDADGAGTALAPGETLVATGRVGLSPSRDGVAICVALVPVTPA
jgi:environmental stress-induced protein Ves